MKDLEELEKTVEVLSSLLKDLSKVVSELAETGQLNVKLFQILNDRIRTIELK